MDDIKEIKQDVKELLQRSAIHNQILSEHKSYSLALQQEQALIKSELAPIKSHVYVVGLMLKIGGMVLAGVLIQALVRSLLS